MAGVLSHAVRALLTWPSSVCIGKGGQRCAERLAPPRWPADLLCGSTQSFLWGPMRANTAANRSPPALSFSHTTYTWPTSIHPYEFASARSSARWTWQTWSPCISSSVSCRQARPTCGVSALSRPYRFGLNSRLPQLLIVAPALVPSPPAHLRTYCR